MNRWMRGAAIAACALPLAAAGAQTIDFPSRTTGSEGTNLAIQSAGDAERAFQAEKERQRLKAEEEKRIREEAERKAAEQARLERERIEREAAAKQAAEEAAAAAAEAEAARAMQARIAGAATPGELFALSDEFKSKGDTEGSRAALRALVARFPDTKLADLAVSMLSGVPMAQVASAGAAAEPAKPQMQPGQCLAALAEFNGARPAESNVAGVEERQVFYGKYFVRMLDDVPACRDDAATAQKVRDDIAANLKACQTKGGRCADGVPDQPIATIDAAYARIVAKYSSQAEAQQ